MSQHLTAEQIAAGAASESGLNLDHLEAKARAATPGPWDVNQASAMQGGHLVVDELYVYSPEMRNVAIAADIADPATGEMSKANADFIAAANPAAVLELIALARRAAPVSAPIAGDALPPLPHPAMPHGSRDYFSAGQMQDYARAALANQPAPTAAPEQVARCVICGSDEPRTGTCGSDDPRALCKVSASQPSEAAPLGQMIAANRDAARYRYLATLMDWSEIERACWSTTAKSAAEFKRGLDKYIDGKIGAAAPGPTVPAKLSASEVDDMAFGYCPSGKIGELRELIRAVESRLAHQPAQEQASDTLQEAANMAHAYGQPELYAKLKRMIAVRAASPVVRAQSEESGQAHAGADEDGERWRFMMAVADDPESAQAKAMEQFGRDDESDDDRPESVQMAEIVDKARAAIRAAQEGGA